MKNYLVSLSLITGLFLQSASHSRTLIYADMVPVSERVAFENAVVLSADRLHVDPNWLMVVFRFESAGTFRPSVRNKYSGAVGLIQMIPSTCKRVGVTPNQLARMSLVEQLVYIEKYFAPYAGKMTDVYDVYLAVFAPAFLGQANKTILYRADSPSQLGRNRYYWNKVLDGNKDGLITIKDVKKQIKQFVPKDLPKYEDFRGIE